MLGLLSCGGGGGGGSVIVTPGAVVRFAVAPNFSDDTLSVYTVNADTGQLRHHGYMLTGDQPVSAVVHPGGRFAYVANNGSDTVSAYSINATTGAITQIDADGGTAGVQSYAAWNGPQSVAMHPSGQFIYVASFLADVLTPYTVNTSTGALTIGAAVTTGAATSPASVAIDPSGRFAYVADYLANSISAFAINTTTGALTRIDADPVTGGVQNYSAGSNPYSVTIHPSGRFAYVVNFGSNDMSLYAINTTTGELTRLHALTGAPGVVNLGTGNGPQHVTVHPAGRFAYVANSVGTVSSYAINTTTGALSVIAAATNVGDGPVAVNIDPSGEHAYVSNLTSDDVTVFNINTTTGALTPNTTLTGRNGNAGLAFVSGAAAVRYVPEFAYVVNSISESISIYGVNAGTGQLTAVTGSPISVGFGSQAIAFHPSGDYAYVANTNNALIRMYDVNSNGTITSGTGAVAGTQPVALAVDPGGRFAYAANYGSANVSAYSINASTGALTAIDADAVAVGTQNVIAAGTNPRSISFDPAGRFLFVANYGSNDVSAYSLNTVSGALSPINCGGGAGCNGDNFAAGSNPFSVAVSASGRFVYVANSTDLTLSMYSINSTNGMLTGLGTVATGFNPVSVTLDPSGEHVYAANTSGDSISAYTVNGNTGLLTRIDADAGTGGVQDFAAGAGSAPYAVAVDPSGRYVYVANSGTDTVAVFTRNSSSGAITSTGMTAATGSDPVSVIVRGTVE